MVNTRALTTLALLALCLGPPAMAGSEDEACSARTSFEPAVAFVGEQVLWRIRVSRRFDVEKVRWEEAPRLPDLRSEWLPGRVEDTASGSGNEKQLRREEHRAVFAPHAGVFSSTAATLLCEVPTANGATRTERVLLPALDLEVRELPEAGRPEHFAGLVGRLTVQTQVDRNAIALGEGVRVSVLMSGAANLWDATAPLPELDTRPGIEVFRDRPTLDQQPGDKLYLRRAFRFDVVPRETGPLTLPQTRVAYFDPETRRYAFATSPPREIRVSARASAPSRDRKEGRDDSAQTGIGPYGWIGAVVLAAIVVLIASAAFVSRARQRREQSGAGAALSRADELQAQGANRAAAAAYSDALRSAIARHSPELRGVEGAALRSRCEELAPQSPALLEAAELLTALDRSRFAADGEDIDGAAVGAVIARLRDAKS